MVSASLLVKPKRSLQQRKNIQNQSKWRLLVIWNDTFTCFLMQQCALSSVVAGKPHLLQHMSQRHKDLWTLKCWYITFTTHSDDGDTGISGTIKQLLDSLVRTPTYTQLVRKIEYEVKLKVKHGTYSKMITLKNNSWWNHKVVTCFAFEALVVRFISLGQAQTNYFPISSSANWVYQSSHLNLNKKANMQIAYCFF